MSNDQDQRRATANSAAAGLEGIDASGGPALIGFDGAVDEIIRVVGHRRSMAPDDFEDIPTIPAFAARAGAAAGVSANIEMAVSEVRFGGNGPLMSAALGGLGAPVTYVGAVGREGAPNELMPLFEPLAGWCREVIPMAAPAHTDALEFDDGKIMLGKLLNLQNVTWASLLERLGGGDRDAGLEDLCRRMGQASLLAVVNWVMMGGVEGIWRGLIDHVLPALGGGAPRIFIDLCDPAKRTDEDMSGAVDLLRRLDEITALTLGLNLSEAERMARVIGSRPFGDGEPSGDAVEAATVALRDKLGLSCVVVHPRSGAAAAESDGSHAWFDGPFVREPRLSTGAGDHFNGGFAFAQMHGLSLAESLAVGTAVSGAYVRDAATPTRERVADLLRHLPAPESSS
jgi:hypothetical protein